MQINVLYCIKMYCILAYLFGGDVIGQGHGLQSNGLPIVAFP